MGSLALGDVVKGSTGIVVVKLHYYPETPDCEEEWDLVSIVMEDTGLKCDCEGKSPQRLCDACALHESIACVGIKTVLTEDIITGKAVVPTIYTIRGKLVWWRCGNPYDGYDYDEQFEVESVTSRKKPQREKP